MPDPNCSNRVWVLLQSEHAILLIIRATAVDSWICSTTNLTSLCRRALWLKGSEFLWCFLLYLHVRRIIIFCPFFLNRIYNAIILVNFVGLKLLDELIFGTIFELLVDSNVCRSFLLFLLFSYLLLLWGLELGSLLFASTTFQRELNESLVSLWPHHYWYSFLWCLVSIISKPTAFFL